MNKKRFVNIVLMLIIVAIAAVGGYFVLSKKSQPTTQQSTSVPRTPTPQDDTIRQIQGILKKDTDNSWLLMSFSKYPTFYPLQFTSDSICIIGFDEGPCSILQSNFNKGVYSPGGGDGISVDGNKQGSTIVVRKLVLNDNFVMNGNLAQDISGSGQKTWNLIFRPYVGDSVNQDPNRPTSTIPLKFDEKSGCGDTGKINCSSYPLHQNAGVFVRGIKYKGELIVRMLTIPGAAPSTLPR